MSERPILSGCHLPAEQRERLYKILGSSINAEVWRYHITGHRLLVCPEPASRTYRGTILLPESAVERGKLEMGAGWVIAAGPMAGTSEGLVPHPGGILCVDPSDLLGVHILYRSHQGINIRTGDDDTEFMGDLIILTDRDVLAWGDKL